MKKDYIRFHDTGYFSKLMFDFLDENQEIQVFYNRYPKIENFKSQIEEKRGSFDSTSRITLASALSKQYKKIESSELTIQNIESLKSENTFTITTGHQLNLFTGPLYFLYKIVSTINLSKELKIKYPECNFVPVYWMATEDHDFDEINYFSFKGKKVQWNRASAGAVGNLSTEGLEDVFKVFSEQLGNTQNAEMLRALFSKAYLDHDNLADATLFLANELFKDYGLVIIDANIAELKRGFIPIIKEELLEKTSYKCVSESNKILSESYSIQVNPREINLFYLNKDIRERIVFEDDLYKVLSTNISWSKSEILKEVSDFPERIFS